MDVAMLVLTTISTIVAVVSLVVAIVARKEVSKISKRYIQQTAIGNDNKQAGGDIRGK